jgi:hypothetical protein
VPKRKEGRATMLPLADIFRDPQLQVRDGGLNQEQADEIYQYAKKKGPLPNNRLVVYRVGSTPLNYLVGGFHRCEAYSMAKILKVPVMLYEGTWAEALQAAARENVEHKGLHRTRADKRRAVQLMLEADQEMSAREIADHIQCSHTFVSQMRNELLGIAKEVATLPPWKNENWDVFKLTNGIEPDPVEPEPTKVATLPAPKPRPQGDEQEFRWPDAAVTIGSLVKLIDKCASVFKSKRSLEHQSLLRLMGTVDKEFKQWYDYCKRQAAKGGGK